MPIDSLLKTCHPGRSWKNYALYRAGDRAIAARLCYIRGVVYDLGCGERPYEPLIRSIASGYVGVDWGNTLHELKADILADLNQPLPVGDGVADTVISFSVLEHLNEPARFVAEACRILTPGGAMVLQVPFMWHVHEAPHDYFRFSRYGLEHLFLKAGFIDVEIEETTGFWLMWFLKLNYQLGRLIRGPRWLRSLIGVPLAGVFVLSQELGVFLDRIWPDSRGETAGYFLTARKPVG